MVNFSKDKILITLGNIFIYTASVIIYYNIYKFNSISTKNGLVSILLLTVSLLFIGLFLFLRFKFYKKNNIEIVRLTNKNKIMIKLFLIFELSAIFISLIMTIIGLTFDTSPQVNIIIYSILLTLIVVFTIVASFMETILRFKMTYDKNAIEDRLEIKN